MHNHNTQVYCVSATLILVAGARRVCVSAGRYLYTAQHTRASGHCDTSFLAQPPPLHWAGRGSPHLDCSSHLQYLVNTSDEALVNLDAVIQSKLL